MRWRVLMTTPMLATVLSGTAVATPGQGVSGTPGNPLGPILRLYLAQYVLPALAAAVVRDGTVVPSGVVGTRGAGADNTITVGDRFHIGSDTKAMTALVAAMFVEQGKLRWDGTVGEAFPIRRDDGSRSALRHA